LPADDDVTAVLMTSSRYYNTCDTTRLTTIVRLTANSELIDFIPLENCGSDKHNDDKNQSIDRSID